MTEPFPSKFDQAAYLRWHDARFPEDAPLKEKLTGYCAELRTRAPQAYLDAVAQLLSLMSSHCATEVDIYSKGLLSGAYTPILPTGKRKNAYPDTMFKSVDSIIDKLWRKNRDAISTSDGYATLGNLSSHIHDLMRTSVVAPTFHHARIFAEHFKNWNKVIKDESAKKKHFSQIREVHVDAEAKLQSGYFAYHCSVSFKDGHAVEVQVYSQLVEAWRRLSHHVYEQTRLGVTSKDAPDSAQTALVSLGHLLHIAETDLERLAESFKR
jgi:ppGpp synthetase/RelA/SpoT-type nucleotidyltranferase